MGSSTYHPQLKQQEGDNSLSLSQPGPLPPSYTNSSSSSTIGGLHSPSHINFHPPRVSGFASSTFASHQYHHQYTHHPHHHHPHSHSPLHDHVDVLEHTEQPRHRTLVPLTTTATTASDTPYADKSHLASASTSASASTTTVNTAPPSVHSQSPSTSVVTTMGIPHHQNHQQQHKDKSQLSVILDAPYLALKGTGPDVESTTLSGHVLLHLTESTTLKEITLQFRGKAKIPMPANESLINNSTSITYVVCNHDWSFLESGPSTGHTSAQGSSSKKHSRTLKAGNHYFPFSLAIGGTLPSSIATSALGGASVVYKLRAVASRPGFAHNLQAIASVPLLRTFTPEALEYQQTLEIENTWPDKMMYAIMLPHKAWAAGDVLGAVVKFSPLGKGVRVTSVVSTLYETSKIFARSGTQEESRAVCSTRHEIIEGRAVEVDWSNSGTGSSTGERHKLGFNFAGTEIGLGNSRPASAQGHREFGYASDAAPSSSSSSSSSTALTEAARRRQQREEDEERERQLGYENSDIVTRITMAIPPSSCADSTASASSGMMHPPSPSTPGGSSSHFPSFSHQSSGTSTPNTTAPSPTSVTPSHSVEPIVVSHRMRWSIYIRNRDGHISELRCSLPVIILDGRLKEEARDASMISRRMMIRSCVGLDEMNEEDEEVWGINALGQDVGDGVGGGGGLGGEGGAGRGGELPSYNAHVRDRVANMFLPEAVTIRVNNPWINRSGPTSPAAVQDGTADPMASNTSTSATTANAAGGGAGAGNTMVPTPPEPRYPQSSHVMSHLPHAPSGSGTNTPLDWVNSELLLSLGDDTLRRFGGGSAGGADAGGLGTGAGMGIQTGTGTVTFSPLPVPAGMRTPPSVLQYVAPVPGTAGSRWGSRGGSRAGSRPGSPERGGGGGGGGDHQVYQYGDGGEERDREGRSRPSSPINALTTIGYVYEPLPSGHGSQQNESSSSSHHHHHHDSSSHGHGMRNLSSLFKATMKPFTSLSHKHRHEDNHKEKDYHHHHQREGRSGPPSSREGSSGGNSRSSREHSPTTEAPLQTTTSAASTYTYDSALKSPLMTNDPFAASFSGTTADDHRPQDSVNSVGLTHTHTSMSTSELAALRRTAISSPYAHVNAQRQEQQQQHRPPPQPLTGPALLHHALTEVPDYSIASRGFIGGVPPLTSMRGLPSYQEAVGSPRTSSPLVGDAGGAGEGMASSSTTAFVPHVAARDPETSPLRSASSEPDLANRFSLSRPNQDPLAARVLDQAHAATALEEEEDLLAEREGLGIGILQRLESAGAINAGVGANVENLRRDLDEEVDEEGGAIEMRMRSRTITQNNQ